MRASPAFLVTALLLASCYGPAVEYAQDECDWSDPVYCDGSTAMECHDGKWVVLAECGIERCEAPCSRYECSFFFGCTTWTADACCGDEPY